MALQLAWVHVCVVPCMNSVICLCCRHCRSSISNMMYHSVAHSVSIFVLNGTTVHHLFCWYYVDLHMLGSMEPWNLKVKLVRKQNLVQPWFHGTVEHVEPQFVNLSLSNNASQTCSSEGWKKERCLLGTVLELRCHDAFQSFARCDRVIKATY